MQVHGWAHELCLVLFGGWGALVACYQGWILRGDRKGPRADAVVVGGFRTARLGFRTLLIHHDIEEPVVRFATINGNPVQATVRYSLPETRSTGDIVEIFYDPREPRKVLAVPGFTSTAKGRLIIMAIGVLFLCTAAGGLPFSLPVETDVSISGLIVPLIAGAVAAARWAWRRRDRRDVMNLDGLPLGDDRQETGA